VRIPRDPRSYCRRLVIVTTIATVVLSSATPPLHHHPSLYTVPPVKRVTRSPQRNLTHNTQYSHVAAVHRSFVYVCVYIYIYNIRARVHVYIYTTVVVVVPASPARRHQGSLYCVIGISRPSPPPLPPPYNSCPWPAQPASNLPSFETMSRSQLQVNVCVCVYANVYNRVLPGGPPGHLFWSRLRIKYIIYE